MGVQKPTSTDQLAAELRRQSTEPMNEADAIEAARNLTGFVRLLAEIDRNEPERGDEDASDGSGHLVHKTKGRADRLRQRRS
jgi:hypothetical protein